VVLEPAAFDASAKIPPARIGTYQFRDNHFILVWCDDPAVRRRALMDRSLGIATLPEITSADDLRTRVRALAESLEVPEVSLADLRRHARDSDNPRHRQRLDRLAPESPGGAV
jgi:DNA-binding transcriptional LysR family regulator